MTSHDPDQRNGGTDSVKECGGQLADVLDLKEAALQSKRRFIDNMSHQIRTLSNAIVGFCDLLAQEDLNETQMEYVTEIYQSGQGLVSLVSNVMDMARIETGQLVADITDCSLAWLVEEIETLIGHSAKNRGLDFDVSISGRVPANIRTDPIRLRHCLMNIAGNAVKYTASGFVHIEISVEMIDDKSFIRFDISDTGSGIPPERQQTIFEPYSRVEDANESILSSLDLGLTVTSGLAMTKCLVQVLGGTVELQSKIGEGSVFTLKIPAGINVEQMPQLEFYDPIEEKEINEGSREQQFSGDILLVEDQPSNRTVITLLLETLGVNVTTAENGLQAVNMATSEKFDLILMDIKMPEMTGDKAAKVLRERGITTPIIALTAGAFSDISDEAVKAAFDSFLAKPVDSRKLQEMMTQFLPQTDEHSITNGQATVDYSDSGHVALELREDDEPVWKTWKKS